MVMAEKDVVNFIEQAAEFRIVEQGQGLLAMIMFINDIYANAR